MDGRSDESLDLVSQVKSKAEPRTEKTFLVSPSLEISTKNLVFLTSRNNPYGFLLVKSSLSLIFDLKTRIAQFVQLICAKQSNFAQFTLKLYKTCTEQLKQTGILLGTWGNLPWKLPSYCNPNSNDVLVNNCWTLNCSYHRVCCKGL